MVHSTSILSPQFTSWIWALAVLIVFAVAIRLWLANRCRNKLGKRIQDSRDGLHGSIGIPKNVTLIERRALTPNEARCLMAIQEAVGNKYLVCPQLPLRTLIDVTSPDGSTATSLRNQINQKRVDFALIDPETLKASLVIELDDRSHQREDRVKRDAFVRSVLACANIKLIRIPAASSYDHNVIRSRLDLPVTMDVPA